MMGLALVIRDHAQALEYDLMTMTGRTLSEYFGMGAAGMAALVSFVKHLPPTSALYRAMHPTDDAPAWGTVFTTNAILADLFDAFALAHSRKGRKPKPYPRPRGEKRGIGKGAIPVREFESWWESGE